MKVVDINTKELIEEINSDFDHIHWTTKEGWAKYKENIEKYKKEFYNEFERLLLYGEAKTVGVMDQMKEENIKFYGGITEEEIDECFDKLAEEGKDEDTDL